MDKVHVFEQAGLGAAPFTLVGVFEGNASYDPEHPNVPITQCKYCSTLIKQCFQIQSADGKTFIVGCDCVRKTGDKGLQRVVDEAVQKLQREKLTRDWNWAKETYPKYADQLSQVPHPYMGDMTMYDYIVYTMNHGFYQSTQKRIISAVKKAERMAV